MTAAFTSPKHASLPTLIDALLAEQSAGTTVEQFSRWHHLSRPRPREQAYRRLMPSAHPQAGEQFAFEVDLDKCSGCKACVVACHSLNGLDDTETWRSVGLLIGPPAVQQHVTTACHHCVDPGCLNGCPVVAYDKDPLTGIVRHLDDQCIGCQYCMMTCPYEVPQYSSRLGIVRKCDMCANRLSAGEPPACAQACPSEAIQIIIVNQSSVETKFRNSGSNSPAPAGTDPVSRTPDGAGFLPDSPDPSLTLPTTRFISHNALPAGLTAANQAFLQLQPAHWPLVIMLLLSQAAAGLFLVAACLEALSVRINFLCASAFALLAFGLLAATLHLGRPLKAWKAFLGWRTSWLSRELIALNAFAAIGALATWVSATSSPPGLLTISTAFLGLLAVFSSGMVYIKTGRPAWCARLTFINFFGATFLLGLILAAALLAITHQPGPLLPIVGSGLGIRIFLFIWRALEQGTAWRNMKDPVHLNARVVRELLPWTRKADVLLLALFIVLCLLVFTNAPGRNALVVCVAVATVISELISRFVYFTAGAGKRMPGGMLS